MRTPLGYLQREMRLCNCQTEAERLICAAHLFQTNHGRRTTAGDEPIPDGQTIGFHRWYYQLALDLLHQTPIALTFRAIMEEWGRGKILKMMRKKGVTLL